MLDSDRIGAAFELLRRHRVDLNLLVDHEPKRFMDTGVNMLVQQVRDPQRLCLFVADLK